MENEVENKEEILREELEVLESIYMDDILVDENDHSSRSLKITLHPNTADDDKKKYVCLTLNFVLSEKYPDEVPKMLIKNPRGLADAHLLSIEDNLVALAKSRLGESMLFELIEYAKDSLTDNNHPSCDCSICLEKFEENGKFFRTDCYHYFHIYCIRSYSEAADELFCPVCRLPFTVDNVDLDAGVEDQQALVTFSPTKEYKRWLKDTAELYERQKRKGGIIDLEEEKNKYLISTNEPTYVVKQQVAMEPIYNIQADMESNSSSSVGVNKPKYHQEENRTSKVKRSQKRFNDSHSFRNDNRFDTKNSSDKGTDRKQEGSKQKNHNRSYYSRFKEKPFENSNYVSDSYGDKQRYSGNYDKKKEKYDKNYNTKDQGRKRDGRTRNDQFKKSKTNQNTNELATKTNDLSLACTKTSDEKVESKTFSGCEIEKHSKPSIAFENKKYKNPSKPSNDFLANEGTTKSADKTYKIHDSSFREKHYSKEETFGHSPKKRIGPPPGFT